MTDLTPTLKQKVAAALLIRDPMLRQLRLAELRALIGSECSPIACAGDTECTPVRRPEETR